MPSQLIGWRRCWCGCPHQQSRGVSEKCKWLHKWIKVEPIGDNCIQTINTFAEITLRKRPNATIPQPSKVVSHHRRPTNLTATRRGRLESRAPPPRSNPILRTISEHCAGSIADDGSRPALDRLPHPQDQPTGQMNLRQRAKPLIRLTTLIHET
jgi:hypothetical protein